MRPAINEWRPKNYFLIAFFQLFFNLNFPKVILIEMKNTYSIIIRWLFQQNPLPFWHHGVVLCRYKVENIHHWIPQTCCQIISTSHNTFAYSRTAVIEGYSWISPIYLDAQFNSDNLSFIIDISDTLNSDMKINFGVNYNL